MVVFIPLSFRCYRKLLLSLSLFNDIMGFPLLVCSYYINFAMVRELQGFQFWLKKVNFLNKFMAWSILLL